MSAIHLVRVGAMGHVGRFMAADPSRYERMSRVVVRTRRGLEIGEVLTAENTGQECDGKILRRMSDQDQLLAGRLEKNRLAAYDACVAKLADQQVDAVLMDVEHLFDGRSLYFYFLGDPPPEADAITAELAEVYETQVQFRKFTETVIAGCGPDCGTENATGGGCDSCETGCAIAGACSPKPSAG